MSKLKSWNVPGSSFRMSKNSDMGKNKNPENMVYRVGIARSPVIYYHVFIRVLLSFTLFMFSWWGSADRSWVWQGILLLACVLQEPRVALAAAGSFFSATVNPGPLLTVLRYLMTPA